MNLLPREFPTGRWGEQFDIGVVDGLLEAAMTANDCVQAFAAAYLAESVSNQQIRDAELVGERSGSFGVRAASASERYSASTDHFDALLRQWARHALHLARISTAVLHRLCTQRGARISAEHLRLADVVAVSTLYVTPQMLAAPPLATAMTGIDEVSRALLASAYNRAFAALRVARDHQAPPEVFDQDLPEVEESITAFGLLELAEALHDYGANTLWEIFVLTSSDTTTKSTLGG
ncbi:hypothetical protein [Dactylosporangium sp. CA-139066]|uniref:hypothetical protein n=1 Tax=Dactylosporangium sp. CA-139066 TaxID=3239930 RepID=UPI003D8D2F39